MKASPQMQEYFAAIEKGVNECEIIALKARKLGFDPETIVDVKLAKNMAERVEGLMRMATQNLAGSGFVERIIELEKVYGALDWRVALKIGEEVAKEKFCKFKDKREAMEVGIRAGFTYHTGGIVSAPLEGFVELRIKKNKAGKDYLAPTYAGPIRGAGGTAATFSLILTDYIRVVMGYDKYDPDDSEVNRFKSEIDDYHERVTNLQYKPSNDEIDFLVRHLPLEIDGEPTEKIEVSNYKDLPRVETNRIRGGVCLVLAEGLSQKAPKCWKRLSVWGKEFGLDWGFLEDFLTLQKKIKAGKSEAKKSGLSPNFTFIADLVAGRPVLTSPMGTGGFRLRYGRSRVSGFSAASINPSTMFLLNNFIATGTQLKMERPGKAASITPCDTIDGPIIKLENGDVLKVDSVTEAKRLRSQVVEILFLGDVLFNYGDFSENNHVLVPPGYNEDWWLRELEIATNGKVTEALSGLGITDLEFLTKPLKAPTAEQAMKICGLGVPLHPRWIYYWKLIDIDSLDKVISYLKQAVSYKSQEKCTLAEADKLVLDAREKRLLEEIGIPHKFANNEFVVIEDGDAQVLARIASSQIQIDKEKSVLDNVSALLGVTVRDKAGTFIGARMGRPEKAKMRKLTGSPQVLFPIGDEGGRLRSFQSAADEGKVTAEFPIRFCQDCKRSTVYAICEVCKKPATQGYFCPKCGDLQKPECKHGPAKTFKKQQIDIGHYFKHAMEDLGDTIFPDLIKGVRGTSNKDHVPENIIKGILRAKHDVYVNKDGTVRFDMSELPITHFKPDEIHCPLDKLKQLGYLKDIDGKPVVSGQQVIEIKPQDVILPAAPDALDEQSDKVLKRIADFVDELLVKMYGLEPYYNIKKRDDLIGQLVVGLAPHISAGIVGRIIGFSNTQGLFAHPLYHAAMRRDCDGDEACVILLMDALVNFSRQYLPDSRGAKTMDAPLVLTSTLNPAEVDDMALGLDIVWKYPVDMYLAGNQLKPTFEVKIEQIRNVLGTEKQYEGMGYTHQISDINKGVNCSAYKALPSMEEKIKGQMDLAEKIRAVDASKVATLVIEKHLLRDTKGNLRKFSTQGFRCVSCNDKFRRPPLAGKCKCGGKILFTVSHGSVIKYLEPTMSLAEKYNVSKYLKQTLYLLQLRIDGVFGKEREKQEGLGKWFG
jgi:DNA polymerase II large subunit